MGCAHSKGALGRCLANGAGVAEDVGRGLALARESAAAGSSFGQFVVGRCYYSIIGNGLLQKTMRRLFDGGDLQQRRGMQSLSATWATCLRKVEVLRRIQHRLFDYTVLQQHRGMQTPLER